MSAKNSSSKLLFLGTFMWKQSIARCETNRVRCRVIRCSCKFLQGIIKCSLLQMRHQVMPWNRGHLPITYKMFGALQTRQTNTGLFLFLTIRKPGPMKLKFLMNFIGARGSSTARDKTCQYSKSKNSVKDTEKHSGVKKSFVQAKKKS